VVVGTVVAVLGLAHDSRWGAFYAQTWERLRPDTTPHGPFANRNHYAGWMLMASALTLSYLCALLDRHGIAGADEPRRRTVRLPQAGQLLVVGSLASLMVAATIQTASRGGFLCVTVGVAALAGRLTRRRASIAARMAAAGTLVLLLSAGLGLGGVGAVARRFADASWSTANGRLPIWRQAMEVARDFPITGSGLNTYQHIGGWYPIPGSHRSYEAAHNDYLQLAAEGGLLLVVPATAILLCLIRETRRRLRESSDDHVTGWLRVGAVVGLSLIAIQETVDYSLQVPGNMALFVVLAAIAVHSTAPRQGWRRTW
jgi:O-antigen ligase